MQWKKKNLYLVIPLLNKAMMGIIYMLQIRGNQIVLNNSVKMHLKLILKLINQANPLVNQHYYIMHLELLPLEQKQMLFYLLSIDLHSIILLKIQRLEKETIMKVCLKKLIFFPRWIPMKQLKFVMVFKLCEFKRGNKLLNKEIKVINSSWQRKEV